MALAVRYPMLVSWTAPPTVVRLASATVRTRPHALMLRVPPTDTNRGIRIAFTDDTDENETEPTTLVIWDSNTWSCAVVTRLPLIEIEPRVGKATASPLATMVAICADVVDCAEERDEGHDQNAETIASDGGGGWNTFGTQSARGEVSSATTMVTEAGKKSVVAGGTEGCDIGTSNTVIVYGRWMFECRDAEA